MLNLQRLHDQLDAFERYQSNEADRRRLQRERARRAWRDLDGRWEAVRQTVEDTEPRRLVARLQENPTATPSGGDRPTPLTLVATDGSQIYPDRHVEPTYFLLNVSQVAFQYGTAEAPLLAAEPDLRFREDLEAHFDDALASMTTEVVSALRDEMELDRLLDAATSARVDGRPLVAMADGTLIRWMIRGMRNEQVEAELIERYTEHLVAFRERGLPLCSYISMPGNTEVVNLLRFDLGELEREDDWIDDDTPTLRGFLDRTLFDAVLAPGQRSAVFGAASHIQSEYPAGTQICYFYVNVPVGAHRTEIARVELPQWVADDPAQVDCIHATVLSECAKGDGYPIILSEAHERAVIRGPEREAFFRLMDRRLRAAGLPATGSRKRHSKQRPRV